MKYVLFNILLFFSSIIYSRSPHRIADSNDPYIKVCWQDGTNFYELHDSHLEELLFTIYDKDYCNKHKLPQELRYRYDQQKKVAGSLLSELLENLLIEIQRSKKEYTDFEILKKKDFTKNNTGLIILKFKNYPFVVKLFIETPQSFINPLEKGFDSMCFFYMGGGTSRYLNGFTRIRNLEIIKELSAKHPYWSNRLDFPRKWFWLPKNTRNLMIKGYNIGGSQIIQEIAMPGTYAIICDEIQWSRPFSMMNGQDRAEALELSNFLEQKIDLHINNYGIDKQNNKLVPIDFEHFPTVVGLKKTRHYSDYVQWYADLASKMLCDTFGRLKYERRQYQYYHHFKPV